MTHSEIQPYDGYLVNSLLAAVDRIAPAPQTTCGMTYTWLRPDEGYVCGRKAVLTCTVCELALCANCDCGCGL